MSDDGSKEASRNASDNSAASSAGQKSDVVVASRKTPPVPGLYVFPGILAQTVTQAALEGIAGDDLFSGGLRDQVMLFDAPLPAVPEDFDPILDDEEDEHHSTLPTYLHQLLEHVRDTITPYISHAVGLILFDQSLARQVIINLYPPGEGISPHIDLPHRYADGILGVSLCGGCVMVLRHAKTGEEHHVYLGANTVYCLIGEARWDWSHGIEGTKVDKVKDHMGRSVSIMRDLRVSVTFRWMKEGADELIEHV